MTARKQEVSAACALRVMKRDRFTCTYCGVSGTDAEMQIDHIIPVANGGSHHISNLTTACMSCNQKKGTKPAGKRHKPVRCDTGEVLVGKFIHTFDERGYLAYSGEIIGIDGRNVIVQLFDATWGEPSTIEIYSKAFIYGNENGPAFTSRSGEHYHAKCRIYADHETFREASKAEFAKMRPIWDREWKLQMAEIERRKNLDEHTAESDEGLT